MAKARSGGNSGTCLRVWRGPRKAFIVGKSLLESAMRFKRFVPRRGAADDGKCATRTDVVSKSVYSKKPRGPAWRGCADFKGGGLKITKFLEVFGPWG